MGKFSSFTNMQQQKVLKSAMILFLSDWLIIDEARDSSILSGAISRIVAH